MFYIDHTRLSLHLLDLINIYIYLNVTTMFRNAFVWCENSLGREKYSLLKSILSFHKKKIV